LEDQLKGNWAEELSRAVWSHNTSFRLLYGEEPVTPKEIKLCSARTKAEAIYSPTEVESKDLLEPEYMKAVKNLQYYQNEMIAWREQKGTQKQIKARDLM
jgi:hypothetical protein